MRRFKKKKRRRTRTPGRLRKVATYRGNLNTLSFFFFFLFFLVSFLYLFLLLFLSFPLFLRFSFFSFPSFFFSFFPFSLFSLQFHFPILLRFTIVFSSIPFPFYIIFFFSRSFQNIK